MDTELHRRVTHESVGRTPSYTSDKLKDDPEKHGGHHTVDIAEATGAVFDDPNIDRDALNVYEDDSPYPGMLARA